jgi:fumarylacetoacetase
MRYANDPQRRSWLTVPQDSDFPIQNLPFGIFSTENEVVSAGTRIGDAVIDLAALHQLGYFQDLESDLPDDVFLRTL